MKTLTITLTLLSLAALTVALAGCHHSKKSVTAVSSAPVNIATVATPSVASTPVTTTAAARPAYFTPMPLSVIYKPGNNEVTAIQLKYSAVTLDKLQKGYSLYAESACIGCHRAFDIHQIEEPKWKNIIDDMALKAHISEEQKNDVYMYVLSVKATQSK